MDEEAKARKARFEQSGIRPYTTVPKGSLDDLLRDAIKPGASTYVPPVAEGISPMSIREMIERSVNAEIEPPVFFVHPKVWNAAVAGECTCEMIWPYPCAVHHPEGGGT